MNSTPLVIEGRSIAEESNKILMCLASSRNPAQAIFSKYEEAQDKDVFVTALIGNLILRHRQWQVEVER